eukprot:jgi/Mesen1/2690/ME000167S01839
MSSSAMVRLPLSLPLCSRKPSFAVSSNSLQSKFLSHLAATPLLKAGSLSFTSRLRCCGAQKLQSRFLTGEALRTSVRKSLVAQAPASAMSSLRDSQHMEALPINLSGSGVLTSGGRSFASMAVRANGAAVAEATTGYRMPPPEIAEIVDAPPTPALSFSPNRDKVIYLRRTSLTPIAQLARPELKLAGLRIDPACNTRSRMSFYTGISVCDILADASLGPELDVTGLPAGAMINFVSWSPNGHQLAFTVRTEDEEEDGARSMLGLWVADVATGQARQLAGPPDYCLNTVFDSYSWVDDEVIVMASIPPGRGAPARRPRTPFGPKIQANEGGQVAQARTYQDLLKDRHDEDLLEFYGTSQLLLVRVADGTVTPLREPAMYTSTMERPFSFNVPCGRFPERLEVWDRAGALVQEVAYLPLAEDIPITFNSVRPGRRSINWRPDRPASLYWVETQDGGDAKVEVSPRDIVYTLPAQPAANEQPEVLARLDLRYGGITWGDDELALVSESWFKTRRVRTWTIAPGRPEQEPKILFDRSYEDSYSDPGSPMVRRTSQGTYVLARILMPDGAHRLLLRGEGATPEGKVPFLDLLDVETGEKERIWQSDAEQQQVYESVVSLMCDSCFPDSPIPLEALSLLMSRESQQDPPQYFLKSWPGGEMKQVTAFPHPYPSLRDLSKEIIKYDRADGVQLTATLYLPPGYEPARDGPRPMLMWAYPREFKSKEAAGQVRGSPNTFAGIGPSSALLWLAQGYTILSGPSMPIIGEDKEEANDSFLEQLVASAQAAVDEVVRRGVAHPNKIAIGGHSYGAFMAANLMAHAPSLFCCAIAQSGTYNRTLTPFGFQNEERTIWDVPDVYIRMSPFMHAHKIKKPVLLVHGEEDNNAGTFPLQSERFFAALKGHGAHCRLVLLPHESHGYSARESIMHLLAETNDWLGKFAAAASNELPAPAPAAEGEAAEAVSTNGSAKLSAAGASTAAAVGAGAPEAAEFGSGDDSSRLRLLPDGRPVSSL